jgi:lambda family phage portal protein
MAGLLERAAQRLASRLGFVPAAAVQAAQAQTAHRVVAQAASQQRALLSSLTSPDVASWQSDGAHINFDTSAGLAVSRARSRDASRNNEHARRFLGMVRNNVLGPYGVRAQARVRNAAGQLATADNAKLEAGRLAFGRRGVFDVTGRYSRQVFEALGLRTMCVDGEVFIRELPGRGPHGVQFQLFTADACPIGYSADLGGGRRIRQGIEFDADGAVLAYHLRRDDATLDIASVLGAVGSHRLVRVPADEVRHLYIPEEVGQLRGVPAMQAALKPMYQAADFASAGLNKARESAKRGGFIQPHVDASVDLAGEEAADRAAADCDTTGNSSQYQSVQDGVWEKLLPGETMVPFESDYPNIEYGQFLKDCRRSIASGLGLAYPTFGNDLEAVNYSSGQLGLEDERTMWRAFQQWWIAECCAWIDRRWLRYGLVASPELSGLRFSQLDLYASSLRYQPHIWRPLDELKTVEAQRSKLEGRLTSPQRIIADNGDDPDEIVAEWAEWQQKLAAANVSAAPAPGARPPAPNAPPADDSAARQALRLRLIANRADE